MAEITGLSSNRAGKKVKVYLDGTFAFTVESEVAIVQGIHVGDILSESRIRALKQADLFQNCLDAALRFLHYRPRSELEIKRRLRSRNYGTVIVEKVISRLKQQGYIDDAAFTRYWIENRFQFNPRGVRALRQELWQKGVDDATIDEALAGYDEDEAAARATEKALRRLHGLDPQILRRRLNDYLRRRGFPYPIIRQLVDQSVAEHAIEDHLGEYEG